MTLRRSTSLPVPHEGALASTDVANGIAAPLAAESRLRGLIAHHFDFIWRTMRRFCVPEADLDDAVQQVFTVASRKLSAIALGSERPFLFQTALRVAADTRRTLRRRREVCEPDLNEEIDLAPNPEELTEQRRGRAMLDALLEELPLDLRAVFVLYEIEELSTSEIARLVGVPRGTVASRLRRAREEFQGRLDRFERVHAEKGDR